MKITDDLSKKYVGIPYAHGGRSLKGFDCWGLILDVYKGIGIELIDLQGYSEDWSDKGANYFVENYNEKWEKVSIPKMYDLIVFRTNPNKPPNHAGVYIGGGKFLQAVKLGVISSRVDENRFTAVLVGFYRYKGMKNED